VGAADGEEDMAQKTVKFNQTGAKNLPNDKPVIYKVKTEAGKTNYAGIAKRGRVQERIQEHLAEGKIPGAKVQIEQVSTIREAQKREKSVIAKSKPKYNKQGK
jgi:excinuclease UvrABC nuclease subunit